MRAPTNPVSINCVGTGVLDRLLIQQNLRMVRETHPYEHRIQYLHLTREVDFAKQKTEGEIARALLPLSLAYGKPAPLTSGATPFFSF